MHDPILICVVLSREFGLRPFCDEVGQNLRLNSSPWLVSYVEQEELNGPFGNPTIASRLFIISLSGTSEATVIEHS